MSDMEMCYLCGEPFVCGKKRCDCWYCRNCGEEFSDYDMMGNAELMYCLHCEDLRRVEDE